MSARVATADLAPPASAGRRVAAINRLVILGAAGTWPGGTCSRRWPSCRPPAACRRGWPSSVWTGASGEADAFRRHAADRLRRHAPIVDGGARELVVRRLGWRRADAGDPRRLASALGPDGRPVAVWLALPPPARRWSASLARLVPVAVTLVEARGYRAATAVLWSRTATRATRMTPGPPVQHRLLR